MKDGNNFAGIVVLIAAIVITVVFLIFTIPALDRGDKGPSSLIEEAMPSG